MKRQNIFNRVAKHLLKQDAKSTSGQNCQYRGTDNKRCAIGVLITNANYVRSLEGNNVSVSNVRQAVIASGVPINSRADSQLLTDLQDVHDYHQPREWPVELRKVANEHNLEFTP